MAQGASDVIIKGRLSRFIPMIRRELALAEERKSFKDSTGKLEALELRYRAMIEGAQEAVSYCHEGMHVDANPVYLTLFGYQDLEELKGMPLLNLINKRDHARLKTCMRKAGQSEKANEFTAVNTEGKEFSVSMVFTPITISGEDCVQISVSDVSKNKALEEKILFMQQRDCLTGLYNRSNFLKKLDTALDDAKQGKQHILICLQINDLKKLNDSLGHAECDKLLLMIGRYIREIMKEEHVLGRIRSGEFAALLHGGEHKQAEFLKDSLESKLQALPLGKGGRLSNKDYTIQLVAIDQSTHDRKSVLDAGFSNEATSQASPQAKKSEQIIDVVAVNTKPAKKTTESKSTAKPAAIEKPVPAKKTKPALSPSAKDFDESKVHMMYQPIMNLLGDPAEFFEVQVYIEDIPENYVPFADFIKNDNQRNVAGSIDRIVIQKTINQISETIAQQRETHFFINVTAATLNDDILPSVIAQHLKTFGLAANRLFFQFEAEDVLANLIAMNKFIASMKEIGAGIVINNFDNDKIGEDHIKDMTIDFLRIDSKLVITTDNGEDAQHLRHAIAGASILEIPTIVFGVDNSDIFSTLYSLGAHYVQGDYLYPAGPDTDVDITEEQTLETQEITAPSWTASA